MSEYGNAGTDGRDYGRRIGDHLAPHGTEKYWQERERSAKRLISQGGRAAEAGRAFMREITSARKRKS